MLRELIPRAAALVAPPCCAACRADTTPGRLICPRCRGRMMELPPPPTAPGVFAAFPYEGPAVAAVAALKFRQAPGVAREMAEMIRERLPDLAGSADVIVPAPAHPARRRKRGYNQARLLARALARSEGLDLADCLRRSGPDPPQSELARARRLELPRTAIRAVDVPPGRVLICDDVTTTGVTIERCAEALGRAAPGAPRPSVRAVVFAAAGAPRRSRSAITR